MRKQVSVLSKNPYFEQKVRLILEPGCEVTDFFEKKSTDVLIIDTDTCALPENYTGARVLQIGRGSRADISIPFSHAELISIIEGDGDCEKIALGDRCVYFRNEKIRLTDVEFSLVKALVSKRGEFLSREELLDTVWGGEKSQGVLNVYIHYLREKLEQSGEKIIISSRKNGYKIDEKYLKNTEIGEGV